MAFSKRRRSFALFSLVTTVAEEAILVAILVGIIPGFGIIVPPWVIMVPVIGWAAWSFLVYRLGLRAIDQKPVVGQEALVGIKCRTTTLLSPTGYIQTGNELWKACSVAGEINAGVDVMIVAVKGLTLLVTPSPEIVTGNGHKSTP
jgi:membrane-bound ClpP family serine protease